jgi:Protein of unknown function (DUF1700)
MNMTGESQQQIEAYLNRLRTRLQGINDVEVRDIVEELRSHITDKLESHETTAPVDVSTILCALGSPEELASQYVTDNVLAKAEVSRSPLQILKSLFRWASLSVMGFFVLLGSMLGYFVGIVLMLVALLKPIHPQTAGLWLFPHANGDIEFSFRLGFGGVPPGGKEVLGWWMVPIGFSAGCALVMVTTYVAVWCVRQYRKSRQRPTA